MVTRELNISALLDTYYSRTMNALFYANLLARHGEAVLPDLPLEPGEPSLALAFRTDNPDIPELARSQFSTEVGRYALILALAHFDRFVLDLAVLDALVSAIVAGGGQIRFEEAVAIEKKVRTVRRQQSVAEELDRLAGSDNESVKTGIVWFRGLYAIRNCLVHRAAIVGVQDKRLIKGIQWRRFAVTLNGEELQGGFPFKVEAGGTIGVKLTESSRAWGEGDHVTLSVEEVQEMMYSLFQLAAFLVKHLNSDFAQRLGMPVAMQQEVARE